MYKAIAVSVALIAAGLGIYSMSPGAAQAQYLFGQSGINATENPEALHEPSVQVAQQNTIVPASERNFRLELTPEMKALRTELWLKYPDTISGMWVDDDDDDFGRVHVSATSEEVLSYVKSKDASIRVERARYSHKQLITKKREVEERLKSVGVGEGSYVEIDEDDNEVRVYLGDLNKPKPGTNEPINLTEIRQIAAELEGQGEIVDVTDDRYDDSFHNDDFDDDWDDDSYDDGRIVPSQAPVSIPPASADQAGVAPAPEAPAPAAPAPAPAAPAQPAKPAKPAQAAKPAKPAKPAPAKPRVDDDDDDRYDDDRDDDNDDD